MSKKTKLTEAEFKKDLVLAKAGQASPSVLAEKWGARGGAFLGFPEPKQEG